LWLGSIKSNIGHAQAAAGVAGVIKMIMAMRHGVLPRTLHADEPSPYIDWSAGQVRVLTEPRQWQAESDDRPRRAAVSSFGVSGTNAHVILEQAPAPEAAEQPPAAPPELVWLLSAKSADALRDQARRLIETAGQTDLVDLAATLAQNRAHLDHRAAVTGNDHSTLIDALTALTQREPHPSAVTGTPIDGKLAFIFSGQGSQRPGMGHGLYDAYPVFAEAFDEILTYLAPELREVMWDSDAARLNRTEYTQPALFAFQTALYRLLASHGIQPDHLIGHSIGEITAAHCAGVLSLPDAATLVNVRARLMQSTAAGGAMAAIQATEEEITPHLTDAVVLGAVNSPTSLVVSGDHDAVHAVVEHWKAQGRKTQTLRISIASHSPHMDPVLEEFRKTAATLTHQAPAVPLISNLTGTPVTGEQLADPDYWVNHLRHTVRYADGTRYLAEHGVRHWIELSPHTTLTPMIAELNGDHTLINPLRRDQPEIGTYAQALATAHCTGTSVDWPAYFNHRRSLDDVLPTYAFQHQRYWMMASPGGDVRGSGLSIAAHPLLSSVTSLADGDGLLLTGRLSTTGHPWLAEHAIAGSVLLPGTAFADLALYAADLANCTTVQDLTLETPLLLGPQSPVRIQITVSAPDTSGNRPIAIHSTPDDITAEPLDATWTRHASGTLGSASVAAPDTGNLTWPPQNTEAVDLEGLYDRLSEAGLNYGPTFQGLHAAWHHEDVWHAEVSLPEGTDTNGYGLHPALLDAALHTLGLDPEATAVRLPFAWSGIQLHATNATTLHITIRPTGDDTIALTAVDTAGAPVLTVDGLTLRAAPTGPTTNSTGGDLYELTWSSQTIPEGQDSAEYAVTDDPTSLETLPPYVVVPIADTDAHSATAHALTLVQSWLADERYNDTRLVIRTHDAVAARTGDHVANLAGGAVWGLIRTAQSEHPDRFVLVDTDADDTDHDLGAVLAVGESQIAIRGGELFVPRVLKYAPDLLAEPDGPWRLDVTEKGTLENLALIPTAEAPLRPGEVRIAVRAAALNFRDVMIALDIYPDQDLIGSEGAGIILETAPDVTSVHPGDRVMGLFFGGMAPTVTTDHRFLAPIPTGWTFAQAAAAPVVYLTAWYGLTTLTDLQRGEKILIHAAAGGVGMAATQIAHHLGAEVYGTASTPKWETVRNLGVSAERIANSRDTAFRDQFLQLTDGTGMDVILNSLAREFVDASLDLLPGGGRFLEIGKTDIRDPATVPQHIAYRNYDLKEAGYDHTRTMFTELGELFESGVLQPLPVTAFDIHQAPDAFRYLAQARHIGKVVLTLPPKLDPSGTVLITGGTGTLGALAARHLVTTHGARDLLLVSRRGTDAPGATELTTELTDLGAQVRIAACDLTNPTAVAELLDGVRLTAVIHATGATDDTTIETLTPQQLSNVLSAKADTAWNLHQATTDQDLAAFILYSSIAGTLGNPGQANYAAANTYLDTLAAYRHVNGHAATSLAWPLWEQTSTMTQHLTAQHIAKIRETGLPPLSNEQGLALLSAALDQPAPTLIPARIDTNRLRQAAQLPPLLQGLVRVRHRATAANTAVATRTLANLSGAALAGALQTLVAENIAAVLGHTTAESVDPNQAFKDLGFDSLTSVELRNRLNTATGLRLPATLIFDHPSPAALAARLAEQLAPVDGDDDGRTASAAALAELERLEAAVAALPADGVGEDPRKNRLLIAGRLQALVHALSGPDEGADDSDLESATDEELFEALNSELRA
jgi:acyl transferase domain-containing protein/NADPH:quinone reductase-like Zn-dependent oxidoreductase/acyl carrier protein